MGEIDGHIKRCRPSEMDRDRRLGLAESSDRGKSLGSFSRNLSSGIKGKNSMLSSKPYFGNFSVTKFLSPIQGPVTPYSHFLSPITLNPYTLILNS